MLGGSGMTEGRKTKMGDQGKAPQGSSFSEFLSKSTNASIDDMKVKTGK